MCEINVVHILTFDSCNWCFGGTCNKSNFFDAIVDEPVSFPAVPSPHAYRAVGHVSLISLNKEKLDSILEHFPGISKIPAGGAKQEATPSDDPDGSADVRLQDVWDN